MKTKVQLKSYEPIIKTTPENWYDWKWQLRNSLKTLEDFEKHFDLSTNEKEGFQISKNKFKIEVSPYYASLVEKGHFNDPVRQTFMPNSLEGQTGLQEQLDPLGEKNNSPTARVLHRYPDRALFLVTDLCSLYCRYCTRKHFTGKDQAYVKKSEYEQSIDYFKRHSQIKEVLISGGDPLTLSNERIETILKDLYAIPHIELIRIGSRIPATLPMRIDQQLIGIFKKYKPIYLMTHFNHPNEVTYDAAERLEMLVDNGVPVFNQMVLLNGVNNDPALIYALSRRLLHLRVKPYYMFQCDPSRGSDHFRTPVEQSLQIQKKLWGRASGLSLPNLSLDIPSGGGKVGFTPNFLDRVVGNEYQFTGWDGVSEKYISPSQDSVILPHVSELYQSEFKI